MLCGVVKVVYTYIPSFSITIIDNSGSIITKALQRLNSIIYNLGNHYLPTNLQREANILYILSKKSDT